MQLDVRSMSRGSLGTYVYTLSLSDKQMKAFDLSKLFPVLESTLLHVGFGH